MAFIVHFSPVNPDHHRAGWYMEPRFGQETTIRRHEAKVYKTMAQAAKRAAYIRANWFAPSGCHAEVQELAR